MQMLIDEHRRLLAHIETQRLAMRALQIDVIEESTRTQEASRMRIAAMETRRRALVQQLARLSRLKPNATLVEIASLVPEQGARLLKLRDELKGLIQQIADRAHVAGRLAAGVLGHLNTAVRLFAGAVGQAGVYTKNGVPRVTARIGVMEAVG